MAAKRNSFQRRMIGETLWQIDHPTAVEVYERVRRDCPQISLGTVYRNLASMADDGEILRLSFSGAPDRFDPNTHDHFHVVCKGCGCIFDINDAMSPKMLAKLNSMIEQSTGVAVEERTMFFSGLCRSCRSKQGA
jgi:Fur family peroxide stress response transcriptional regulator